MAVVIETTLGDITVDLYLEQRPVTCLNFLKLCRQKYYNFNLFHTIRNGFIAQTGDPTGAGSGGESIFGILEGPEKRFFSGEKMPKIRHANAGLISMVCTGDMMVGSQFFFTLAPDLDSLDGVHCVIGEVTEGHEVLRKLNEVICDETHRPYQDVRITHTVILEDPYNDPPGFHAPSRSPSPSAERLKGGRIAPDEELDETQGKTAEEIQEIIEEKEAKARATILEIVGDLPDADIAPPENVLFVCKLNPVTTDEDLEIIFSRFGKIVSCEVIRDKKTGDSLQYAFIEFSDKKSCEDAYFKMDNVLIDDRRIHVDFSQSVSKMRWLGKGRGVQHFDEADSKDNHVKNKTKQSYNQESERERYSNRHKHERDLSHNSRQKSDKYISKEENHDKKKRLENDRKQNKARSPSRSLDRSRKNRNREKSRDRSSRSHRNSDSVKELDRSHDRQSKSHKEKQQENSSSHRQRSPSKDIDTNKQKNNKTHDRNAERNLKMGEKENNHKEKESRRKEEKQDRNSNVKKHKRSNSIDESQNENFKRVIEQSDKEQNNKRLRKDLENKTDVRTPSPAVNNASKIGKNKKSSSKKVIKKVRNIKKKKRKPSTSSSDTDSSDSSSSSSESSSSSYSDRKKRKRRKQRKYSSSSSDSSDSSSSSSSSDSSSESTSSSSDSEKDRKKSKKNKKKIVKKSRKK